MRNLIIAAFIAACAISQGEVRAEVMSNPSGYSFGLLETKISPDLVNEIIKKAAKQSVHSYSCLCSMYLDGSLTIEKAEGNSYRTYIQESDGGVTIISILEDF